MKNSIIVFVMVFLTSNFVNAQSVEASKKEISEIEPSATLSGAAFVTKNIEASIKFYTEFLGFKEMKRIKIDTPAGLANFGVTSDKALLYVALVPAAWSKKNPNYPGLNFIEIQEAKATVFKQDGKRPPIEGEVMKAYAVNGLHEIEKRMRKAGIPIIAPITLSATGKSQTLAVIDPNGVRVQMYEYIKK